MDFSILTTACSAVFGESCAYTPGATGVSANIDAIFSRGAIDGQPDATGPVAMEAKVSAFSVNPERGDVVTWNTRTYRVLDVREDMTTASYEFSLDEVR